MSEGLTRGPLGPGTAHVCVDMQGLFVAETDWHAPWAARVLPAIERLAAAHPEATVFTRFIPARRPGDGEGTWRRYYERWASMTLERLDPDLVELAPALRRFVPPAALVDKTVYSPWLTPALEEALQARGADAVVVTGGETDVCVLATVLGAVDRGYRVVVAKDALCSSSDAAHDASLKVYGDRYGQQVELATVDQVLEGWA